MDISSLSVINLLNTINNHCRERRDIGFNVDRIRSIRNIHYNSILSNLLEIFTNNFFYLIPITIKTIVGFIKTDCYHFLKSEINNI